MNSVLIPFTDPESAERAVRKLLDEAPSPALEVELLAVVEPLVPGRVRVFLSPERAEVLARAAAARWLARIEALLDAANIRHRSEIAVGRPAAVIDAALRRPNIDRVLLPPGPRAGLSAAVKELPLTRAALIRHGVPYPRGNDSMWLVSAARPDRAGGGSADGLARSTCGRCRRCGSSHSWESFSSPSTAHRRAFCTTIRHGGGV